jgi:bifunctional non-homologous end joining protein LigD
MEPRALQLYRKKRRFGATPEPRGRPAGEADQYRYVIQKHAARRLHYDFRLELDGTMKSWAVTRGPSLVPGDKRLAIHVEDHPLEYADFEGTIPKGEYGGGTVMIWDRGHWHPDADAHAGYRKGHLSFTLAGEKLKGRWHLVRLRQGEKGKNAWLLIKGNDESAREPGKQDVLEELPLSVASGRSLSEIADGRPRKRARKADRKPLARRAEAPQESSSSTEGSVRLTHPERIYWPDAGITKQDLVDYYRAVWTFAAPQIVGRPLALVRCPDGTAGQCFFQKHAAAGLAAADLRVVVDNKKRQVIAVDDLNGMLSLVQAGTLEVHVRGSTIDHLDLCNRIVFDLDPGEGVAWSEVVAAARAVRERLDALKLVSFVKLSGGKGLHVVLPTDGVEWAEAKAFAETIAQSLAADEPERYVAKMAKSLRAGKIFVDYLRNSLEQTSVAAYSTRAREAAPVSMPVSWQELGRTTAGDQYSVRNVAKRLRGLKQDPWMEISNIRQRLPRPRKPRARSG